MRVLHVIPSLSPTSGGPSFALPAMAGALTERGVKVTAVATDDDGPRQHLHGMTLGESVAMQGWNALYFRKQTEFYKISLPMRRWLRRHVREFDAVHIHAVFSFASLAAGRAAAAAGVPYVVRPLGVLNRWGMENRRRLIKLISFRCLDLPMLRRASAMHYTSRPEMEEAGRFGFKNLQRVIPIGMDLSSFDVLPPRRSFSERFPETAATRNILFLSRIDEKKGLDLLIAAFGRIATRRPDLHLLVCGSGPPALIGKLKQQAAMLGIADRITWAGQVTGERRLAAFSAAELFVLPSHSENFGIALLEAMAAGLPCLSTDQVALALDAVQQKAVLLAARTPEDIAAKLEHLLDSPELRGALSHNAHHLSRVEYSLPAMGEALHSLYCEIAKN